MEREGERERKRERKKEREREGKRWREREREGEFPVSPGFTVIIIVNLKQAITAEHGHLP